MATRNPLDADRDESPSCSRGGSNDSEDHFLEGSGRNLFHMEGLCEFQLTGAHPHFLKKGFSVNDLTYEQTIELEQNVKIKNQADELYKTFLKKCSLHVSKFKDGKFELWSDQHNAAYLKVSDDGFVWQGRFLHESYDVPIKPGSFFTLIKQKYRGMDHVISWINNLP